MNNKTTRRNFLKSTSLISTSLIVGFKLNSPNLIIAKDTAEVDPNLYVIISPNNTITFKLYNSNYLCFFKFSIRVYFKLNSGRRRYGSKY